jgi:hypothetical protein
MNLPAFTAQASLYRTSTIYRSLGQWGEPQRTVLIPQLRGPGAGSLADCLNDCADAHPDWTAARCRLSCRDPGGIPGSGSGQQKDAASIVLCWANYGLCTGVGLAIFRPDLWASCIFSGICSCEDMRDSCLSN